MSRILSTGVGGGGCVYSWGVPGLGGVPVPGGCQLCCDIGQIDRPSRIELFPSNVLSSEKTNYKNDIQ